MAKRKKRKPNRRSAAAPKQRPRQPDWPVLWLALIGVAITAYLTLQASTTGGLPLCDEGSACDIIQESRWSTLFGIPVALWGLITYALIALPAFEMRPGIKRWRWFWTLSLIGLSVSIYLTVVGIVQLQAVCLWCLASLATIAAIFVVVNARRPHQAPGRPWHHWLLDRGLMTLAILAIMHLHYAGYLGPGFGREDPQLQALAEHLDEQDVRYYGAFWCPACQEQNELFGASYERLPYVECTPDGRGGPTAVACMEENITEYPTWVVDGEHHRGILEPEELARLTDFDWEED